MKKLKLLLLMGIASLVLNCQQQEETTQGTSPIEMLIDSLLADPEIKALSVGIIDGDQVYTFHKGTLLNGKSPNDQTGYKIASLTKTFTGTLFAHALAEGKTDIDQDIRTFLSGEFPNLAYQEQPITFRHLVTHQSGLPHMFPDKRDLFENPDWEKLPYEINALQEDFSREEFFSALSQVELDTFPGANFGYSNAGANLLGYLLEGIYTTDFEEVLRQKIWNPLQMKSTQISQSKIDFDHFAYGQNVNGVKMPLNAVKDMSAEGGIVSSTKDMLQYFQFHLDESNEVVAQSHQHLWEGRFGDFEAGLFWQINKNGDQAERVFQNGGAYGTSSWVTLIPEEDIAVFLITNVAGMTIHQKLSATVDLIIEEIEEKRTPN